MPATGPLGCIGLFFAAIGAIDVAKKDPTVEETPSAWTVRQKLEELLEEEFGLFRRNIGCEEGDNYKAATAILEGIRYLREYNVNHNDD
jgi:hypothetical protein